MADDIAFIPAIRLLALYRGGQLSPVEVIEHTLRRLETYESAINAFVLYDPETALAMARASEARWQKGEPLGLLDGVPVARIGPFHCVEHQRRIVNAARQWADMRDIAKGRGRIRRHSPEGRLMADNTAE